MTNVSNIAVDYMINAVCNLSCPFYHLIPFNDMIVQVFDPTSRYPLQEFGFKTDFVDNGRPAYIWSLFN